MGVFLHELDIILMTSLDVTVHVFCSITICHSVSNVTKVGWVCVKHDSDNCYVKFRPVLSVNFSVFYDSVM